MPELFRATIDRPRGAARGARARVRIYGLLEARLQTRRPRGARRPGRRRRGRRRRAPIPGCSRPMRHALGLDLPERRIGLSAHDFAQALGATEVILTRAAKLGGAPTVASRFVQRLAAVAGEARWDAALRAGAVPRPGALARRAAARRPIQRARGRSRRSRRARGAQRHRDRGLAARSLHDLCPARAAPAPLDAIDTPPGAPIAARSSTTRSATSPRNDAGKLAGRSGRRALTIGERISLRSMIIPRRAHSGGRASCASREWLAGFESRAAATLRRSMRRSAAA